MLAIASGLVFVSPLDRRSILFTGEMYALEIDRERAVKDGRRTARDAPSLGS